MSETDHLFPKAATGRCSVKKDFLKNFANFIEKHQCWSLFLTKLQTQKRLQLSCFSVKLAKFLKAPTLKNICKQMLLYSLLFIDVI